MEAWGHTITIMIGNLPKDLLQPSDNLVHAARILDKYYLPTRYPNGFDSGAPTDYFTKEESFAGIEHAEAILEFCRLQID
jgi:HEPN domain-containing protein